MGTRCTPVLSPDTGGRETGPCTDKRNDRAVRGHRFPTARQGKREGQAGAFRGAFESLAEFKNVHGHFNVSEAVDSKHAHFCKETRMARRNPLPGVTMKLTQDRISTLTFLDLYGNLKLVRQVAVINQTKTLRGERSELASVR